MWSSKQTTTNNTASDNKKKEEVVLDDCRCSSEAVDAASSHAVEGSTGQPQQLNVFDHNSKRQTTTTTSSTPFGGNLTPSGGNFDNTEGGEAAIAKEKDLSGEYTGETVDSGFVSGPLSGIIQEPDEGGAEIGTGTGGGDTTHKFNITVDDPQQQNRQQQQKQKQQQQQQQEEEEEEKIVLDSGCITEDFTEDYDDDVVAAYEGAVGGEEQRKTNEQLKQVQHELSNATVAAAASSTTTDAAATSNDPMLFKQNVDSGMSEWFCNLSLQSEATPRPQQLSQQQQQPQVAGGIAMNNLDSTGQRAVTMPIVVTGGNTISFNQNSNRQQQQQAAGNSAINNNTTTATTNLTPSSAWEQFYQQNDDGDTPMHLACISGYVDVVAALIRMAPHPCLFNIQNDVAQTPLHLAALTAQPKILRMLLIAGAEPTIRDRHGNTALHLACISGEEQCVRALTIPISASEINEAHRLYGHRSNDKTVSYLSCARLPSDLEIRNYDGERCVHLAAQSGHIDILRILVLYGADINAREGKSGRTPLHIAIECCNEDLANFLLDECQKLNLETATYAGLTAYQVACVNNKSQMQNILEKRGAEPLTPPDSDYDSSDIETDLDESKIYDRFGDPGYFISYNGGNPMTVA